LIAGVVLLACVAFWHLLFLHLLGFWPAVIADFMFAFLLVRHWRQEDANTRYELELRAKENRGEPLQAWEYELIHPKPSAGLSLSDIALGVILGKLFFSNDQNKK
jgi:hypothetical protein